MGKNDRLAARRRHARDREVTRIYGPRGHRQCGSKARYRTEEIAEAVAMRRMALGGPDLRWYPCDICGGWHLTSAPLRRAMRDNGRTDDEREGSGGR